MAESARKRRNEFFEGLLGAMDEGLQAMREGRKLTRRTVMKVTPAPRMTPRKIVRLRKQLHVSQPVFASLLNVAPQTVRAWEQGRTKATGATLRLLHLIQEDPERFAQIVTRKGSRNSERIFAG